MTIENFSEIESDEELVNELIRAVMENENNEEVGKSMELGRRVKDLRQVVIWRFNANPCGWKDGKLPRATIHIECKSVYDVKHNFPCPVCIRENAVYQTNTGVFVPCRKCQSKGWFVARVTSRFKRWFLRKLIRHFDL